MRIRTIKARTVAEALTKLQAELGPNALVLESKEDSGGAEVIAADVEREEPADGVMRLRAELALLRRDLQQSGVTGRQTATASEASAAVGTAAHLPGVPGVAPRLARVAEVLQFHGVDPRLVRRVLASAALAPATEGNPLDPKKSDFVRNALAGILPGGPVIRERRPRCFAFVGPAGAGKTTTIAKLMQQARGSAAGKDPRQTPVAVLSLDGERPGGAELLRRTAERLGLPFRTARGAVDLAAALDELPKNATVLVDTAGLGLRDHAALEALRGRIADPDPLAVHLVLPANLEPTTLLNQARRMRPFEPAAIVFTHLDETERLGNLINAPCALDLPAAAFAHGRSLAGDLAPATRALVANIVLGRRPDLAPAAAAATTPTAPTAEKKA